MAMELLWFLICRKLINIEIIDGCVRLPGKYKDRMGPSTCWFQPGSNNCKISYTEVTSAIPGVWEKCLL